MNLTLYQGKWGYIVPSSQVRGITARLQVSESELRSVQAASGPLLTNGLPIHVRYCSGLPFAQRVSQEALATLHVNKNTNKKGVISTNDYKNNYVKIIVM